MKNISILNAFGDNYIYAFEYSPGQCFVVDPGDAKPVLEALDYQRLKLTHIFITHHHADHIGGVSTLKQKTGCEVMGPDKQRMPKLDTITNDFRAIGDADVRMNFGLLWQATFTRAALSTMLGQIPPEVLLHTLG